MGHRPEHQPSEQTTLAQSKSDPKLSTHTTATSSHTKTDRLAGDQSFASHAVRGLVRRPEAAREL